MSLFKGREWWSTSAGCGEEFDLGCLCVANINNDVSSSDKIIVGSYHGMLRIFMPRSAEFKPEDLMLEIQMSQPILQVEAGRYVSGSDKLHLGILHPRKFSVYSVSVISGAVEHGNHFTLQLVYEHILDRTAYSFTFGPFGSIQGKDFICVASMDGMLSFFEQEMFAFGRFLPGFLLPAPVRYVVKTDSFVTCSSSKLVECFKYQTLAAATDAETKESKDLKKISGKRLMPDWTCNIGDNAVNVVVAEYNNLSAIFVLGERGFYGLQCNGALLFMKKFEYNSSCILPYGTFKEETFNLLVGTHNKTLMIYQNITLIWAAQLPHCPVDVRVANFTNMKGIIVTLDETGHIYCSYLGTDPSMFIAPPPQSRDVQYDDIDDEMRELHKVIRESSSNSELVLKPSEKDELSLLADIPTCLDETTCAVPDENGETYPSITVKLALECCANYPIGNVTVAVDVTYPIICNKPSSVVPRIGDAKARTEIEVSFYLCCSCVPSSMKVRALATYTTALGSPRISQCEFELPVFLVLRGCSPIKNAICKLTLDSNKPSVDLGEIFQDMVEDRGEPQVALGLEYINGPVVTILVSKTSQRYRIQCDRFDGLWLVVQQLVTRLHNYFADAKDDIALQVSFAGPVPLKFYFELIDNHFEQRLNQQKYREILAQRSAQFRAIQRRLLTKYKDKTPSPLGNLDTLLDGTYRQLLALGEAEEDCQRCIQRSAIALSCGTRLINLLLKLWKDMKEDEYKMLQSTLCADIVETDSQGWEEITDAAVTHLLKTSLSKGSKDHTVNPQTLEFPKDTSKLKKHIALLCERLNKGSRMDLSNPTISSSNKETRSPGKENCVNHTLESVEEERSDSLTSPRSSYDSISPEQFESSTFGGRLPSLNDSRPKHDINTGGVELATYLENMKPFSGT
ncbi:protein PTHB1-like [Xenia sp. Carnegie-2017]|uniref:protein PTHB1-like n=1 Tax=Xenia sp. Carnegie-2017 TaxID=2897299 RepID=UPI001F045029|nr:protein PTHB1-like [Xenia sp. Carnegie-2017]